MNCAVPGSCTELCWHRNAVLSCAGTGTGAGKKQALEWGLMIQCLACLIPDFLILSCI